MSSQIADVGLSRLSDPPDAVLEYGIEYDTFCNALIRNSIVFVHGLQGHPEHTWSSEPIPGADASATRKSGKNVRWFSNKEVAATAAVEDKSEMMIDIGKDEVRSRKDKVFWPKDYLAEDFPNARVMTFGYNTKITEGYHAANHGNIFSHAKDLLYAVEAKRRRSQDRPLLFVAHSLGGILVKEALRRSEADPDPRIQSIFKFTIGVFFFGTPHRGSRDWASFGDGIAGIASRLVGVDANQAIVQGLLPASAELELCRESFTSQWVKKGDKLTVRTFQESKGLSGVRWGGFNKLIVPADSSSLDHPNQRARTLNADHIGMCKFASRSDPGYEMVKEDVEELIPLAKEVQFSSEVEACLTTLSFLEMDFRRHDIDIPHENTGNWLFQDESFARWINYNDGSNHGLLWVKGNPGAGKSTLMKEAFRCERNMLRSTAVAFFFHARGYADLQKTSLGFFRSIWYQLVSQDRTFQEQFVPIFRTKKRLQTEWTWSENELKDHFRNILPLPRSKRVVIFIDGLDECDQSQIRTLVQLFRRTTMVASRQGGALSICLSSRHYPHISVADCAEIFVENNNYHDIEAYVAAEFHPLRRSKMYDPIRKEIVRRANGIFLWVVLVTQIIRAEADSGAAGNTIYMLQRLESVPDGLEQLFRALYQGMADQDRRLAFFLIEVVLHAARPLTLAELSHYFPFRTEPYKSYEMLIFSEAYVEDIAVFERRILDLSRGLVKANLEGIVPPAASINENTLIASKRVQFIHQSARDFFVDHSGLTLLDPRTDPGNTIAMHTAILAVCKAYIGIEELSYLETAERGLYADCNRLDQSEPPFMELHFLRYAVLYWKHHYQRSACQMSFSLSNGRPEVIDNRLRMRLATLRRSLMRDDESRIFSLDKVIDQDQNDYFQAYHY